MDKRKKKILFASPKKSLFTVPVTQALKDQGYDVFTIDYRSVRNAHPLFLILTVPLIVAFFLARGGFDWLMNVYILLVALLIKPQAFLVIKGETIQPWLLTFLKKRNIRTVNWYPDDAFQLSRIRLFADHFDVLCTFDPYIKRLLEQEGFRNIRHLPFADNPDTTLKREPKEYPLVFIGQSDPIREAYLESVKDLGLLIWGPWEQTALKDVIKGFHISEEEVRTVYRRAKIVINIHSHSFNSEKDKLTEGTNLRTFMAAGVGAFQLIEYRRDLENLFELGKELISFNSKEDFRDKAIYYLEHEKERNSIASAAYARVKKEHTYAIRMKEMVDALFA